MFVALELKYEISQDFSFCEICMEIPIILFDVLHISSPLSNSKNKIPIWFVNPLLLKCHQNLFEFSYLKDLNLVIVYELDG